MNSKETLLVSALINTEDGIRHNKAVKLIFFGKEEEENGRMKYVDNEYSREIKKRVRILYGGQKYAGCFDEIYSFLSSAICRDLVNSLKKHGEGVIKKGLIDYILSMVHNSAYRKEVDDYLWADRRKEEFDIKDDRDLGSNEESYQVLIDEEDNPAIQKKPKDDDDDDSVEEIATSADWAAFILDGYIKKISNQKYRDILVGIDIEGLSPKQYAKKAGETDTCIHQRHKEALIALAFVALRENPTPGRSLFVRFKDELTSTQVEILQDFFDNGNLGRFKNRDIAIAYRALVNIANKAFDEERREFLKRQKEKERQAKASTKKIRKSK